MNQREGMSDSELVLALQQEGRVRDEAIRSLYRQYYSGLTQFVLSNGGNEQDADDIFQETVVSFIELVRAGKFRQEASVKTLVYTINRNTWYTEITKRGRQQTRNRLYVAGNEDAERTVTDHISGREARNTIMNVLGRLGETCKQVLLLFYYENLPMKEILAKTSYESEQAVRNKKYKCLKQLEQLMQETPALYEQMKNALSNER